VRGAAQRATCANNLHQIGAGLQNYHATHRRFPPGGVEPISPKWPKGRQLAWSAFLLPFVEQADLHRQIDFGKPFNAPENAAAAARLVPVYVCPSVSRQFDPARDRAPTDYGGIYGQRITGPNNPPKGMMLYDRALSTRDARDGTSTTLIVGEAGGWPDGQWINGLNIFDQAFPINQAPAFENDMSSKHPGGAYGLFCDGNARFLSETLDPKTLAALCTREGGEVVEEF
jgi:prepilin-type processing-associated H-X9-DG protein